MRYADHAYAHAQANEKDTCRAVTLDRRAAAAGFNSTPDYIDDVMGRADTKSYEASNNRVGWMNANERLYGWNNRNDPSQSTIVPKSDVRKTIHEFERHKNIESRRMGIAKENIKELGPIPKHQRDVRQHQRRQMIRLNRERMSEKSADRGDRGR